MWFERKKIIVVTACWKFYDYVRKMFMAQADLYGRSVKKSEIRKTDVLQIYSQPQIFIYYW